MATEDLFLESARKRFAEYKALGEKALDQLSGEELHWRPNEASNSIALLIKHLWGNMRSRWTNFLTEDGEKEWRLRDEEFETPAASPELLRRQWEEGWKALLDALNALQPADLTRTVTIRTQPLTVIDAINRQLMHYAYHVGQIVSLAKWCRGDAFQTLSIPKGQSDAYNAQLKQEKHT